MLLMKGYGLLRNIMNFCTNICQLIYTTAFIVFIYDQGEIHYEPFQFSTMNEVHRVFLIH